jgi:hypothetical protein
MTVLLVLLIVLAAWLLSELVAERLDHSPDDDGAPFTEGTDPRTPG